MRHLIALVLALLVPTALCAAPIVVKVVGPDGTPLAGAVVQVQSDRAPPAARVLTGPFVMAQQGIAFQPHTLIVPVGAAISFPNRDKVRHHVYSFSPAKKFELKLYGKADVPALTFDRAGVVALGCNIHDSMSGFIIVVDTPYAAATDAQGRVSFGDVPGGAVRISVWHPSIRAAGNTLTQPATVAAAGLTTQVTVRR